jgi:hypothetical protein
MNQKIKALAILPLAASLTFFGLQAVTYSIAATESGSEPTEATTGATAETIEDCEWYLTGVETTLSLVHGTDMEYVGDDYELTAENNGVKVYFSGTVLEDDRCSFYDDVRGADVDVTWDGTSFTNVDGADTSLDWVLGDFLETDPTAMSSLDVSYAKDECDDAFEAGDSVLINTSAVSPLTPASIDASATSSFSPSAADPSATFAKCTLNATYTVVLPGGLTPLNPGSAYIFNGPLLTTTITVNDALVG